MMDTCEICPEDAVKVVQIEGLDTALCDRHVRMLQNAGKPEPKKAATPKVKGAGAGAGAGAGSRVKTSTTKNLDAVLIGAARPKPEPKTTAAQDKKIMKSSHASEGGRTLVQRIEVQVDKRRKILEDFVVQFGQEATSKQSYYLHRGRYEGLAAALAILRSSSFGEEVRRSDERLGIE